MIAAFQSKQAIVYAVILVSWRFLEYKLGLFSTFTAMKQKSVPYFCDCKLYLAGYHCPYHP